MAKQDPISAYVTEAKPNSIELRHAQPGAPTTHYTYSFGKQANTLIFQTYQKGTSVPGAKGANLIVTFVDQGLQTGNVGKGRLISLTWGKTKTK